MEKLKIERTATSFISFCANVDFRENVDGDCRLTVGKYSSKYWRQSKKLDEAQTITNEECKCAGFVENTQVKSRKSSMLT